MNLLITGASGFVGRQLCEKLVQNHYLLAVSRGDGLDIPASLHIAKEINANTDWHTALESIDVVIHLANRAHVMHETSSNPYQAYKAMNVDATLNLARQALKVGVKRFIYMSSVKVNGEISVEKSFAEIDGPRPEDDYGKSKYEAEETLKSLCESSEMELVIIRPPLIYGPSVKANFLNLIKLCNKPVPLPFGAINNQRSFVYIENLISFIEVCLTHKKAANQTFLISDNDDQSTANLVGTIRQALGKPKRLVSVPKWLLSGLLTLLGRRSVAERLMGNLQVNPSKAMTLLDWKPQYTFKQGIDKTITHYNNENDKTHI